MNHSSVANIRVYKWEMIDLCEFCGFIVSNFGMMKFIIIIYIKVSIIYILHISIASDVDYAWFFFTFARRPIYRIRSIKNASTYTHEHTSLLNSIVYFWLYVLYYILAHRWNDIWASCDRTSYLLISFVASNRLDVPKELKFSSLEYMALWTRYMRLWLRMRE